MVIDNSNYAVKNKLSRMVMLIVIAAIIVVISMLPELDKMFSVSRYYLTTIIVVFYISFVTFRFFKNYYFVFFSTDLGKITVRYYHLTTLMKKYKAFEFPIAEYYKHEIIKKGLKHELIIYRKEGNKITKYPSVSITSLKDTEIKKIESVLNSIKTM